MRGMNDTVRAILISATLHLGIVALLCLAMLSCSSYEHLFKMLHLPPWLNPVTCERPSMLAGPILDATLVGVTSSSPARSKKKVVMRHAPAPSVRSPSRRHPTPPPKIKSLPPPPEHPGLKNQKRVVAEALRQARIKHIQEAKERQHQAELKAIAAKRRMELKRVNALFTKMDAAARQTRHMRSKALQARQKLAALHHTQADVAHSKQVRRGNQGDNTALLNQYAAAIQNAVTPNWLRPENMPQVPCRVHIIQLPGGKVVSATVDSSCPYDAAGKRSIENAVLRTGTLPYQGFEKVFSRNLILTFMPK